MDAVRSDRQLRNNFDRSPRSRYKIPKRGFRDAFNQSTEAFRENELPRSAIYLRNVVTCFVYSINLSLHEIRFESFKFEIQSASNSMEMHLIDKPHPLCSFSSRLFLP